jgi:hypothetical protein
LAKTLGKVLCFLSGVILIAAQTIKTSYSFVFNRIKIKQILFPLISIKYFLLCTIHRLIAAHCECVWSVHQTTNNKSGANVKLRATGFYINPSPAQKKTDTYNVYKIAGEANEMKHDKRLSQNSKHINGRALNAIQESFFG